MREHQHISALSKSTLKLVALFCGSSVTGCIKGRIIAGLRLLQRDQVVVDNGLVGSTLLGTSLLPAQFNSVSVFDCSPVDPDCSIDRQRSPTCSPRLNLDPMGIA